MSFRFVFLPAFRTEIEAMEWAFDNDLEEVRVWRGPDGLIRGSGKQRIADEELGAVPMREVG